MKLDKARDEINKIDREMAALFSARMKYAKKIAKYKSSNDLPVFDPAREAAVIEQNLEYIKKPSLHPYYTKFIKTVMDISKDYQKGESAGLGTKLIVPITDCNAKDIYLALEKALASPADIIEWRADCFVDSLADYLGTFAFMGQMLTAIKEIIGKHKELLFTYRTKADGGTRDTSIADYYGICRQVIDSEAVDYIDLELRAGKDNLNDLCAYAHKAGVKTIVSYHDFEKPKPKNEILEAYKAMAEVDCDIMKVAVMAESYEDVLNMYKIATFVKGLYPDKKLINICMGEMGAITRIYPEKFASFASFAPITSSASNAPGQIDIDTLIKLRGM